MDSVNPQAPSVPMSAGLGIKVYRYRSLIRRHWWVLALTIGLGLAYEGIRPLEASRSSSNRPASSSFAMIM